MRLSTIVGRALAGLAGLSVIASLASCQHMRQQAFIGVCERAIQANLIAPKTYKRTFATMTVKPLSVSAYRDLYAGLHGNASTIPASSNPVLYSAFIEYDASNAFNAPLRSYASCAAIQASPGDIPAMVDHVTPKQDKGTWARLMAAAIGESKH